VVDHSGSAKGAAQTYDCGGPLPSGVITPAPRTESMPHPELRNTEIHPVEVESTEIPVMLGIPLKTRI